MSEIKTFAFDEKGLADVRNFKYGTDWPVVYLLENGSELYVGETVRVWGRSKEHLMLEKRRRLNRVHVISDDEFNMSATKDIESSLIEYLVADNRFVLQNNSKGLQNHSYFDREKYTAKFEIIWKQLQEMKLADKDLLQLRNSDIFKYSPYKTLTDEQHLIASQIIGQFKPGGSKTFLIHGGPGTGKTILATYLIKRLVENGERNVALVVAMTSLRNTLRKVFRSIPGLKSTMVIGPSDVLKRKYEILIVDETHRLRQRKNIPNYGNFDKNNRKLGLENDGNELDWILKSAPKIVLFYDEKQNVRPSDIPLDAVLKTNPTEFTLTTQMRVKGGKEYLNFVDRLLEVDSYAKPVFQNYDFRLYSDIKQMVQDIQQRDREHKLARIVAGYAWDWVSRKQKGTPDIDIDGVSLFWNSRITDWVNSPNSVNEVGCIHTIQGYDLNYAGVIIGPEISLNPATQQIVVDRSKYQDVNGHRGVDDAEELKRLVVNIYKTLLTRGILGTYVYVSDPHLREYFRTSANAPK